MEYTTEFDCRTFPWTGQAARNAEKALAAGKADGLNAAVEEHFEGTTPRKGQVNDFVWFSWEEIAERLGLEH